MSKAFMFAGMLALRAGGGLVAAEPESTGPEAPVITPEAYKAAQQAARELGRVRTVDKSLHRVAEDTLELLEDLASNGGDLPQLTQGAGSLSAMSGFSRNVSERHVAAAASELDAARAAPSEALDRISAAGQEMARAADVMEQALNTQFKRQADVMLKAALDRAIADQDRHVQTLTPLSVRVIESSAAAEAAAIKKLQSDLREQAENIARLRSIAARARNTAENPYQRAGIERVEMMLVQRRLDVLTLQGANKLATNALGALEDEQRVQAGLRDILRELLDAAKRAKDAELRDALRAVEDALKRERALQSAVLPLNDAALAPRRDGFAGEQRSIRDTLPESADAARAALAQSADGFPRDAKAEAERKIAEVIRLLEAEKARLDEELNPVSPEQQALADLKKAIEEEKKLIDEVKAMDEKTFDEKRGEIKEKQEDIAEKIPEDETPKAKEMVEESAKDLPVDTKPDAEKKMEDALNEMKKEEKRLEDEVAQQEEDKRDQQEIDDLQNALDTQNDLIQDTKDMTPEEFEKNRDAIAEKQDQVTQQTPESQQTPQEKSKEAADAAKNKTQEETQQAQQDAADALKNALDQKREQQQGEDPVKEAEKDLAATKDALTQQERILAETEAMGEEEFETRRDELASGEQEVKDKLPEGEDAAKDAVDGVQEKLPEGAQEDVVDAMTAAVEQLKAAVAAQEQKLEDAKAAAEPPPPGPPMPGPAEDTPPPPTDDPTEHDAPGGPADQIARKEAQVGEAFASAAGQKVTDMTGAYAAKLPPEYREMLQTYYRTLAEKP